MALWQYIKTIYNNNENAQITMLITIYNETITMDTITMNLKTITIAMTYNSNNNLCNNNNNDIQ